MKKHCLVWTNDKETRNLSHTGRWSSELKFVGNNPAISLSLPGWYVADRHGIFHDAFQLKLDKPESYSCWWFQNFPTPRNKLDSLDQKSKIRLFIFNDYITNQHMGLSSTYPGTSTYPRSSFLMHIYIHIYPLDPRCRWLNHVNSLWFLVEYLTSDQALYGLSSTSWDAHPTMSPGKYFLSQLQTLPKNIKKTSLN